MTEKQEDEGRMVIEKQTGKDGLKVLRRAEEFKINLLTLEMDI